VNIESGHEQKSFVTRRDSGKLRQRSVAGTCPEQVPSRKNMDESPSPPPEDIPQANTVSVPSGSPSDFLKGVVGKKVVVRLTSGVDYRGSGFVDVNLITENSI